MKIIIAFIRLWWHCLIHFHRMETFGYYIKFKFLPFQIPVKYIKISCGDCDKYFYFNGEVFSKHVKETMDGTANKFKELSVTIKNVSDAMCKLSEVFGNIKKII